MRTTSMFLVFVTFALAGCNGFGAYPVSPAMGGDAGVLPMGDGGSMPRTEADAGTPGVDSGHATSVDAGHAMEMPDAYIAPAVDAGTSVTGCISGTFEMCTRTCGAPGQIACNTATGRYDGACEPIEGIECPTTEPRCTADTYRACTLTCGRTGQIACNTATGLYDGACLPFAGYECPAPSADAGPTGSSDAGVDAYVAPATDAGSDAGVATTTVDLAFTMDPSLYVAGSMAISEEMAATGATHANAVRLACGGATTTSGTVWYHCLVTRPVGSDLYFVGTFTAHYSRDLSWTEGQILATASGYGRTTCGDGSVTRGIAWAISAADGHSLLPSTGVPETVQPRGITEDGYPVCRHHIVF